MMSPDTWLVVVVIMLLAYGGVALSLLFDFASGSGSAAVQTGLIVLYFSAPVIVACLGYADSR